MEETDQKIKELFQNAYDRVAPDQDRRKALLQTARRIQARSKRRQPNITNLIRSTLDRWTDLVSLEH